MMKKNMIEQLQRGSYIGKYCTLDGPVYDFCYFRSVLTGYT